MGEEGMYISETQGFNKNFKLVLNHFYKRIITENNKTTRVISFCGGSVRSAEIILIVWCGELQKK